MQSEGQALVYSVYSERSTQPEAATLGKFYQIYVGEKKAQDLTKDPFWNQKNHEYGCIIGN